MHPNPAFRRESDERAIDAARARSFGILTVPGPDGVLAAHVPFVLRDDAASLEAHLVRSNPIARLLKKEGAHDALLIVQGPDAYISPDWYCEEDRVPTWNYVAVHLRGRLALRPQDDMRAHLDRVSANFEERLRPKHPWTATKMTPSVLEGMMRQIVPVEMTGLTIDSTFKLNQNRTRPARLRAAGAIEKGGTPGMETLAMARLMRGADDA